MAAFPSDRFDPTLGGFALARGGVRQVQGGAFDIPGIDLQLPFRSELACPPVPMFRQGTSVRPIPLILVPHPETGAPVFYKHAGRPILFSGDLAASRKVARVARLARRSRPR